MSRKCTIVSTIVPVVASISKLEIKRERRKEKKNSRVYKKNYLTFMVITALEYIRIGSLSFKFLVLGTVFFFLLSRKIRAV